MGTLTYSFSLTLELALPVGFMEEGRLPPYFNQSQFFWLLLVKALMTTSPNKYWDIDNLHVDDVQHALNHYCWRGFSNSFELYWIDATKCTHGIAF